MRSEQEYKDLIKKYSYSLSVLKIVNAKLYKHLKKAEKLMDENGLQFSKLIRNLRIDFFNGNDTKEVEEPQIVVLDNGISKEKFVVTYAPELDYMFGFLYEKETPLYKRGVECELYPNDIVNAGAETLIEVLRTMPLDSNLNTKKTMQYFAGYLNNTVYIVEHDSSKTGYYKTVASLKWGDFEEQQVDACTMF